MIPKIKKILVTGGAGYIGSHTIVELLESGYQVVSIDNFSNSSPKVFNQIYKLTGKKIKNYNLDLCDYKKLGSVFKDKEFYAIIHFAAYKAVGESVINPLKYYQNNLGGLIGALKLAQLCKVSSLVYSSSAAVYDQKEKAPYQENSSLDPISPYGVTKKIGEDILKDYTENNSSLKTLSLRYFNPVGAHPSLLIGEDPKASLNNLIPAIVNSAKNRELLSIFGNTYHTKDGTSIRDYVHVVDVARAHVLALKYLEKKNFKNYDVFNIGTGKGTSVLEIIRAFETTNNLKLSYFFSKKRPGDVPIVFADTKKSRTLLKFKPKYDIFDMLKTAWGWGIKIR